MTLRRVLGGLGALAAVAAATKAVAARHRALAAVLPELRHPMLYLPMHVDNPAALAFTRRLPVPPAAIGSEVRVDERTVGDPAVKVLTYEPSGRRKPGGALLWLHGGGKVMGSPRHAHAWCGRVAEELGVLVVNVDYRLAPENPYPAGLDDGYGALLWLHRNASDLGVDPDRIAVGGDSAGGGLAAALAQRAHDDGVPVRYQLLVYPMLDDRTVLRTRPGAPGAFTWTARSNRFGWTSYLGRPPQEHDDRPYVAAARRADLSGLAPAWIGVGDLDLFHAESVEYAERLRAAGVDCELVVVPGMYHAADALFDGRAASVTAFRAGMVTALREVLG